MRNGLLTTIELAEILEQSDVTVRRWTEERAIPPSCVMWTGKKRPIAHYKINELLKEGILTLETLQAHATKHFATLAALAAA